MGCFETGPYLIFNDGISEGFCEFANSICACFASLVASGVGAIGYGQ